MTATVAEAPDLLVNTDDQVRVVLGLLREYSEKLAKLAADLLRLRWSNASWAAITSEAAWLLDQWELIRKPLLAILSRGSAFREIGLLAPLIQDELSLRMFETEAHLHHAIRAALELRDWLSANRYLEHVDKMRVAAGLPTVHGLISASKIKP